MLFFLCRWKILLYFGADRCARVAGWDWLPARAFSDGGLSWLPLIWVWHGCPRHVASRKAPMLSKNCLLARKRLSESICVCILSKTNQSSLAFSMPPYVRKSAVVSAIWWLFRAYVVSVGWVWCRTESVLWVCVLCACGVCQCVRGRVWVWSWCLRCSLSVCVCVCVWCWEFCSYCSVLGGLSPTRSRVLSFIVSFHNKLVLTCKKKKKNYQCQSGECGTSIGELSFCFFTRLHQFIVKRHSKRYNPLSGENYASKYWQYEQTPLQRRTHTTLTHTHRLHTHRHAHTMVHQVADTTATTYIRLDSKRTSDRSHFCKQVNC